MKTYPISHFDHIRDEDQLIIFTVPGRTKTNSYGFEAVVKGSRVVSVGSNDNTVPEGGFVISGHGKAAGFVHEAVCEGAKVTIDREKMIITVEVDDEAKRIGCEKKLALIKDRLAERVKENAVFDREKAEALIKEANDGLQNGLFDKVHEILEDAYYVTAESKKGEVRAVWHRPLEKSFEEVEALMRKLKDAGFNQILIETDYEGHSNALKLKNDYLPVWYMFENGFDPIDAYIKIGKKLGIEVHAWFEDFFCGVEGYGCKIGELHPEWLAKDKNGGLLHDALDIFYYLNPVIPEVREFLLNHIRQLLDAYDFDGFQLDYIRYPVMHSIERCAGFDDYSKQKFLEETGIDIDTVTDEHSKEWKAFVEWRAKYVTMFVSDVYKLIMEYRKKGRMIKLSTAVFGDPDEAIRLKSQDWRYWVTQGWLDAIYPMAYLDDAKDVGKEVGYMVKNYGKAPNISGISPMYHHLPAIESTKQVEECRKAGASGVAFFCAANCTDDQLEKLKKGVFREE